MPGDDRDLFDRQARLKPEYHSQGIVMESREVKRPGRPELTITPLSAAERRRKDAEGIRASIERDRPVMLALAERARKYRLARQRSPASDDTE